MHRNAEGYPDPTAGAAWSNICKEQKQREAAEKQAAISTLIHTLRLTTELAGFEIVGRITLRDKTTGKEYR